MCLAYAVQGGAYDEAGLEFGNEAILDISAPRLTIEPAHETEWKKGEPCSYVRTRFILLDHTKIKKIGGPSLGRYDKPTTKGDWGQFEIWWGTDP